MSLYDGVDIDSESGGTAKSAAVSAGWSASYKLLQSQLQAKKASLLQTKKQRTSATLAPVIDLKRSADSDGVPLHFNLVTGKLERLGTPPLVGDVPPFLGGLEPVPPLTGGADEYHPLRPNDYEDVVKRRKAAKQKELEEERRKEAENKKKAAAEEDDEKEFDKMRRKREEEEEEEYEKPKRGGTGAAIAPPQSLLEDSGPSSSDASDERSKSPPPGFTLGVGGSVASRIMAKYGYKAGQGLGKSEQGMSTALFVEKTSKRGGKIIHEKDLPKEPPKEMASNTNILKNPSKVILLRNMVGPGEVDEDLEPEVAEECSKYGKVVKVMIFEIPNGEDEEAVRIFVEFDRMESATKALVDLNGRYFGGRIVKGTFYNLDKFRRLDLADQPE